MHTQRACTQYVEMSWTQVDVCSHYNILFPCRVVFGYEGKSNDLKVVETGGMSMKYGVLCNLVCSARLIIYHPLYIP